MITAIILAAGQSRRMGRQKLLLPFAGQTVIGHVADQFIQSLCAEVFVVVSESADLKKALICKGVKLIINPDLHSDMLSSVRAGIKSLPPSCEAVLITPGDMPLIHTAQINQLIQTGREEKIVAPVYEGRRGHPLLVPRHYFKEILTCYDGIGLRGLLQTHANEVCEFAVNHPGVLQDIDLPEDYEKALQDFNSCSF